MKKLFILTSIMPLALSSLIFGQEKEVSSSIGAVTVFYQGAQVSRTTADVTLPKDQTILIIKGLEQSLQENSLRVGVKGPAKILNVVKTMDYLDQKSSSLKIEELNSQLKTNNEKIEDHRVRINVYEQERNMLMANMKLGGANNGVTVAQIKEGASYYHLRLLEIETSIIETKRLIVKLEDENQKIQAQLTELNYRKNRPSSRLEVTVELEAPATCGLLLDYFVPEANWIPSYDIRIDQVGDPVKLIRKATLRQFSGEDWDKVSLTFSTGNPMEQQLMPVLNPWYVDFVYQQNNIMIRGVSSYKSEAMNKAAQPGAVAMQDSEAIDEQYDMFNAMSAVESGSNNSILEFNLKTKASVSADGKEYAFSLGTEELKASYHYLAVPKKEKAAYLVATMTDWEGYELVDGVANIYYEKMFIGETYLSTSMTLDSMQLSMGKDKGLIVDRIVVKDFTRTRNMGSNLKKSFGYEVTVRNTKSTELELIVEDQIPVSSNSQITIEKEELGGGIIEEGTGKVTWRITVKPGETVKLPLRFSVKYPKDKSIDL